MKLITEIVMKLFTPFLKMALVLMERKKLNVFTRMNYVYPLLTTLMILGVKQETV